MTSRALNFVKILTLRAMLRPITCDFFASADLQRCRALDGLTIHL
jgi:hypothetical protein